MKPTTTNPRSPTARRHAAFLRGVSPMNCKMPDLKRAFEAAGYTDVKTVLSSGNVVFGAPSGRETADGVLATAVEAAIEKVLGRSFAVIVRSIDALAAILAADPYARFRVAAEAKRVITFLKETPKATLSLPIEIDGARILCVKGSEVFTAYVATPKGPVFMTLIEKTFGKNVTTRTWETVKKVAAAGGGA
jgi:uncharacterized protein (DUF1697 family)